MLNSKDEGDTLFSSGWIQSDFGRQPDKRVPKEEGKISMPKACNNIQVQVAILDTYLLCMPNNAVIFMPPPHIQI